MMSHVKKWWNDSMFKNMKTRDIIRDMVMIGTLISGAIAVMIFNAPDDSFKKICIGLMCFLNILYLLLSWRELKKRY